MLCSRTGSGSVATDEAMVVTDACESWLSERWGVLAVGGPAEVIGTWAAIAGGCLDFEEPRRPMELLRRRGGSGWEKDMLGTGWAALSSKGTPDW